MKSEVLYIWAKPTNPFYNPEKINDGGGYWQYEGMVVYIIDGKECVTINLADTSCGDFGTRYHAWITTKKYYHTIVWGSMDGYKPLGDQKEIIESFKKYTGIALTTLLAIALYDVSQEAARKCGKRTTAHFSQDEIESHIVKLRHTKCKETAQGEIEALMDFSADMLTQLLAEVRETKEVLKREDQKLEWGSCYDYE